MDDLKHKLFETLLVAVNQAGVVARAFEGKVENVGKEAESMANDNAILVKSRTAKTLIDETVQEIILTAVAAAVDPTQILLDTEEDTPTTEKFSNIDAEISLILDPIDGTSEYIAGIDDYSINVGLVENGEVVMAIVYFPARDQIFWLGSEGAGGPKGNVFKADGFYQNGLKQAQRLIIPTTSSRTIFKNARVPEELVAKLSAAGFDVHDFTDNEVRVPGSLLRLLAGESVAFIGDTMQIRDQLLCAIISRAANGFSGDWSQPKLVWPKSGRVLQTLFGNASYQAEIYKTLNL